MSQMVPTTTLDDFLLPRLNLRRDDAFDAHIKVHPACINLMCAVARQQMRCVSLDLIYGISVNTYDGLVV